MKHLKKTSVILLCLVMLFSSISVFATEAVVTTAAMPEEIIIIHTNDTHGRVSEGKYDGMGLARIKTYVNQLEAEGKSVLVMDAGDAFHGTTFATLEFGASVVEVFNEVGYDVLVPGNHDFNYGQDRLLELSAMGDFDIIAANVKKGEDDFLSPYVIKEVDGIKVGIFGIATPETTYKTHPDNVAGLTFEDPVTVSQAMVDELSAQTDVIVALVHLGNDNATMAEYKSETIAMNVSGIDVIIDGHSHQAYENGYLVNETMIASAGEYDKNIGVVTISINENKAENVTAMLVDKATGTETLEEDEGVVAIIDGIKESQESILSQVVGSTSVKLDGERGDVRSKETNLGNLITDSMIAETGAMIAINNGGGIRASIDVGEITKGEIITVLPFGNYIVTKELSGSEIKAMLEHGTSAYPEAEGMFPQVGGLTFSIDLNKSVGDRVTNINVAGMPIDLNKEYIVATNNFVAAGGDGYTMFGDNEILNEYKTLDEALIEYAATMGTVAPMVENRISVIEKTEMMPSEMTYTVMEGDMLWKIGKMYDVTYQSIAELNNIENPHMIFPGQVFKIPMQ